MKRFFPRLVQQLFLLPLFLLVSAAGATVTFAAQLTATWTESSTDVDVFKIERGLVQTGPFSQINTTTVTSYTDTNLAAGTTYCYRVRAHNAAGDSDYSSVACKMTAASQNFTITVTNSGTGSGTVSSNPTGINCGTTCSASYASGTTVTLTATPATGSTFSGWSDGCSGTGSCTIVANTNTSVTATFTAVTSPPPPTSGGLMAAYNFDEGSQTLAHDASGNNNTGTLTNGPLWTTGEYGKALSFDGVNDYVAVPNSSSLDISGTNLTLSLWVNLTDTGNDMALIAKPWTSNSMLDPVYQYALEFDGNSAKTLDFYFGDTTGTLRGFSMAGYTPGTWAHIAFTYNGTTVTGYLNGVQKLSVAATQSIQARGNSLLVGVDGAFSQAFKGQMDQVRVYNRALTASEISTDMNTPVGSSPPPSSYALTVTKAGTGSGTVSSSPTGINCGATCSASFASGTSVTLTATPAVGSTFSGWSVGCSGTATTCTVTMNAATSVTATFTPQSYALTVSKAGTGSGTVSSSPTGINCGATCSASFASGTSVTLTAAPATGSTFSGWSGGCSGTATTCTVTMNAATSVTATFTAASTSSGGLKAAYSFDEGSGTLAHDASGNNNTGTLTNGPLWTTGKYGKALSFDGVNDYVAVPNSSSLDISGKNLTLSLWVNLTDNGSDKVLLAKLWSSSKSAPYYQYALEFDGNGAKTLDFYFGDTTGTLRGFHMAGYTPGTWAHVAFTYNGTTVTGYINGVQKLSVAATQSIQARGNSLQIGVDGAFGQAFKGTMDQVRIYNRALTTSEIQTDMNTSIK